MPSGIILSSSSQGATKEAVEKVLTDNGYEPDKPEEQRAQPEEAAEPKREDFETDEAFEQANEEFQAKQDEAEAEREDKEEAERQRQQEARHPKLTRRQRAINKATRKLQDDLKAANDRLAALEGKKPAAEAAPEIKAPKREDFKSDQEFEEAVFDYRYKVRRAKEDAENSRTAEQNRLKENYENYVEAIGEFKETHDDWDEVVNQKIPIHESVYLTIQELENGPAVTYYLGKNPAYAEKLAEMSPLAAVVEVGRLAERLKTGASNRRETDGAAKPKPKPRIPEPVRPVASAASASTLSSREAAQKRDFHAFKAAQRAGR